MYTLLLSKIITMKVYQTSTKPFTGTKYIDVYKKAFSLYRQIKANTKRRPYIRSAYFRNEKIFLGLFWQHLNQKNWKDRTRRLKFYPCGIELIKNSKNTPISKDDPSNSNHILHRFGGITLADEFFYVQIKESKITDQKFLISIFPDSK
ncbi:hypothetical protein COV81_04680 [Candidatus Peregrinibacteria bacterium CG11_big_fil_rev_8_21_14_0_20_41_10]|nr:MAG: hypothetical protein COV81_04680 [Candidatus Peregrinibacteria bacterium CG11_big_fil_rev_8_21_14_0_20_41_10]PIZ74709.1 MAG: hypothetical protein COY06_03735 [Candidatus Peregrinibacteria bacterium CG_4_10_14_0_2_um_filter_41_8]PJC37914.1 MAG: hypothetical protein CO045_03150 [Candidatus Peregrinibacteria bacterium CG_4_9_14_0_2_um_filter_41_14]